MHLLVKGALDLGLSLTQKQIEQFHSYHQMLTEWNQRINLTSIIEPNEVQVKHFVDSLTATMALPSILSKGGRFIDIGSGGGFPGIPIKLLWPNIHLTLVESVGKKTSFLSHLTTILKLNDVEVSNARAELLAHKNNMRESFDVVISRGLAPMYILTELMLPFCKIGGVAVALKKGSLEQELSQANRSVLVMGGHVKGINSVDVDGLRDKRVVVAIKKVTQTPDKYPRKVHIIRKRPI